MRWSHESCLADILLRRTATDIAVERIGRLLGEEAGIVMNFEVLGAQEKVKCFWPCRR